MEVLRRIDKGYSLVDRAKKRADKLLDIQAINQLEREIHRKVMEEQNIRAKIDEVKASLLEREKFLAETEKKIECILKTLYDGKMMEVWYQQEMKEKERLLLKQKERAEQEMFHDFALIDSYTKALNIHKHKSGLLEKKLSKQKINQHEKLVYLEDKIKTMEKKIKKLRKSIDVELLDMYDERRQKTSIVFSAVEEGHCKLCEAEISEEMQQQVVSNERIINCMGCGRILYMDRESDEREDVDE